MQVFTEQQIIEQARRVVRVARFRALASVGRLEQAADEAGHDEDFAPHIRRVRELLCTEDDVA